MGKVSVTIEVTADNKELVEKLLEGVTEEKDVISASKLRKGKKAAEPEDDDEADDEDSDDEDSDDDEADDEDSEDEDSDDDEAEDEDSEDEDSDDDDDKPAKGGVAGKDLSQLKIALKVYAGKHGKAKAVKILHQFGKTSEAVKKKDLPKLLKLLKV